MLPLLEEGESMKNTAGEVIAEPKKVPKTSHIVNTVNFVQAPCKLAIGGSESS